KVRRPAPIAHDLEIAKREWTATLFCNGDGTTDDPLAHEIFRSQGRFVVEHDTRTGEQAEGSAIALHEVNGRRLGRAIGRPWPKRGGFIGRSGTGIAQSFAGAGIVKSRLWPDRADGFEDVEHHNGMTRECLCRLHKGLSHGRLAGQVVDLRRRYG